MAQHDLDPVHSVAMGDTVWDVEAAHRAGVPAIAIGGGGISACRLSAAGADEIWSGPADLLAHVQESRRSRLR